jgi:hypothetical protein
MHEWPRRPTPCTGLVWAATSAARGTGALRWLAAAEKRTSVPHQITAAGATGLRSTAALRRAAALGAQDARSSDALAGEQQAPSPEPAGADRRAMTTGCYRPRHAGEVRTKVETTKEERNLPARCGENTGYPRTAREHSTRMPARKPGEGETGGREGQDARTPIGERTRGPRNPHADTRTQPPTGTGQQTPQVPTYIPSPCPAQPRIGPHAPCLLGLPRHGGPSRRPIRGRVSAFAP